MLFEYRTYNQKDDFSEFRTNFTQGRGRGTCYDKIGLDNETCSSPMGCAKSRFWTPKLLAAYISESDTGTKLLLHMEMPIEVHSTYGAPLGVWLELTMPADGAPTILADLQYSNKTATRLPESLFFSLPIAAPQSAQPWQLHKLGGLVNATDVMPGGGVHLHSVAMGGVGAVLPTATGNLSVQTLETGLVSIGLKTAFPTPLEPLTKTAASGPLYFVLQNNLWDTNYPLWYPFIPEDANGRFRFQFTFH